MNKQSLFKNSEIDLDTFLQEYWHQKPLLLKNVFTSEELAVLPDKQQLIDLSSDEEIQSRVVIRHNKTRYCLESGPFFNQDFEEDFSDCTWNLLVSDIDKWCPESHTILKHFNFIRSWMFDDLMLSCGSMGGTVGPHLDNYDVFLLQSHGQRRWQFKNTLNKDEDWLEGNEIKVLAEFEADEDIILNPGDLLYLPPRFAHYGSVASEDCVTSSIGLRSPSAAEILTSYVDSLTQKLDDSQRFVEPRQDSTVDKGEFNSKDMEVVSGILSTHLNDEDSGMNIWFGKFITEYRSLFHEFNEYTEDVIDPNKDLHLNSFARVCYQKKSRDVDFFANGEHYQCSLQLAKSLCEEGLITSKNFQLLDLSHKKFLQNLFENGTLLQA